MFRFSPFSAASLLENAQGTVDDDRSKGREPRWGISVLAGAPIDGESIDDCLLRLLAGRRMSGRKMQVAKVTDLERAGFPVILDEPPPNHHLILLGDDPDLTVVENVAAILAAPGRRNNPAERRK